MPCRLAVPMKRRRISFLTICLSAVSGAQRFYMILLAAFVLFYPAIDPLLFGYGSNGRLSGYGDAGYYIILALGLNIVVGFAGLLDLGYVAFFAIGSYAWG